jgi:hypothetical protein
MGADGRDQMRVLVVLEDDYRLYREMLAECLRIKRTGAEVERATPESLEEELERFDPRVIICSGHKDVKLNGGRVWIELFVGSTLPARVSTGHGGGYELANPTLEGLLEVIDEFA